MLERSVSTLLGCNFTQNSARMSGGAVNGAESSLEIKSVELLHNRANHGGGIYLYRMNTFNVDSVVFEENSAVDYGGAITLRFGQRNASISNCNFFGNRAPRGASIHLEGTTSNVVDSRFKRNNATDAGAGLFLYRSIVTMRHGVLLANTAKFHAGISVQSSSMFIGQGVAVLSNMAFEDGGGIGIDGGSSFRCRVCEFKDNVARRGAGMFANSDDSSFIVAQLQNSQFEGNNASKFGGMRFPLYTAIRFFYL